MDRPIALLKPWASEACNPAVHQGPAAGPWPWGNSPWRGWPGGAFALFREMEESDAHLHSVLQTRKNCLLACDWRVMPADDSAAASGLARDIERALRAQAGLEARCR